VNFEPRLFYSDLTFRTLWPLWTVCAGALWNTRFEKRNAAQIGCIILPLRYLFFAAPAAGSQPATYLDRLPEKGADSLAGPLGS
jgi:hypothetical protein